jgi:hypothetical protein
MIFLYAPAGANCNYILGHLLKINIDKNLVYHKVGTHSGKFLVIDRYLDNVGTIKKYLDNKNIKACIFHFWKQEFNEFLYIEEIIPLQILIDNYSELVVINWIEKFLLNPSFETDKNAAQEWRNSQKKIWDLYTKFPLERAVLHWLYKIHLNVAEAFEDNQSFTKKFYFSSMYESHDLTKEQFKKFDIEYTKKMYEDWKTSQNKIFDSWNLIKSNIDTPEYLPQFYQRGIAIALDGLKKKLKEQECWDQLSKKLQ